MKKFFSLLLIFVLSFSLLCACTPTDNPTDSVSGTDTGATISSQTDTEQNTDTNTEPPIELTLQYDDRYEFPADIASIVSDEITSKQARTEEKDEAVLKEKSRAVKDTAIACGTGKATVTLTDGSVYKVTVTPAPISVFLILGQSNGEGSTTGDPDVYNTARNQSIVCEEGKVYSTYAWSTIGHATSVAGITSIKSLAVSNASFFVAQTLTSKKSVIGVPLEYQLNTFSKSGAGKVGFDSGLAWKWNQLTGEKVWIVNCAAGSTAIEVWLPGQDRYEKCRAIVSAVKDTMDAEIAAGHYELKNYAYFWLQGESNSGNTEAAYRANLETLHKNLKKDMLLSGNKQLEAGGIILVRAFHTTSPSTDTYDNGPRKAQKAFVRENADAFMACDVNDQWISAQGVTDYWEKKYPGSVYPFTVHANAYKNPTAIATVHTGVHYLQPGYNEIGIEAATQAYDFLD